MSFDWEQFLSSRHIPYVTSGPSATRGNIAIQCPWCGADDPSQHLAISIEGRGWRCFRRKDHAGKSPAYLIAKLLGCSMDDARSISGQRRLLTAGFADRMGEIMSRQESLPEATEIAFTPEMRTFDGWTPAEKPFRRYLERRGFWSASQLSNRYGLRYARRGRFAYRVIFPVTYQDKLVNLTARSINPTEPLRYMTMPKEEAAPISNFLLWYDEMTDDYFSWDADTLVLCEGPFDALKVNYLGEENGVCATCFFTAEPSERQIDLLHELAERFDRIILLQDRGAFASSLHTASALRALGVRNVRLPKHIKDPGELSPETFGALDLRA